VHEKPSFSLIDAISSIPVQSKGRYDIDHRPGLAEGFTKRGKRKAPFPHGEARQ
jgi:hypothetical protein